MKGNKLSNRVGQSIINKQGFLAVIIKYRNTNSIDIKFEDGAILTKVSYSLFKSGGLCHPNFKWGKKKGSFGNFTCNGLAYKLNDNSCFYYCECSKCGLMDILSPKQMLKHKC